MSSRRDAKESGRQSQARPRAEQKQAKPSWTEVAIPLAIFVLAFGLRLLYLFQIEAIPLFYNLASDGRSYDEWAQRIAAGDWLGHGVFYQAPLYPYFLGLLQFVIGHDLWWIRVAQVTLGAASCVLLYWTGRTFFSRGAGIAAGLILSLYAPAIFFEALIQKTALDLFLITLFLLLLGRAQWNPHWALWAVIGAVLALLGLTRENALVWLLAVPLWMWFYFPGHGKQVRLGWVAIFFAAAILVLLPVGVRNLMIGGEFTLTTSQLGPNFFIGNNPAADGTYAPLRAGHGDPQFERQDATELAEQALGRQLSPREVSGYWLQQSLDYIRSQPLDWLRLMGRKWMILWNVRELVDAEDFYLYQGWSWLLGLLGWMNHFGVLAPVAALGFILTWGQWRKLWLLYLLLATLAFSVAFFYVFGRYRFSVVPLLTLFAGAGLAEGFALYRRGDVHLGLRCGAVLLLSAVVVHWPIFGRAGPSSTAFNNLGNALAKQGKIDEAIQSFERALRLQPASGSAHYNLGNILASQGKLDEARRHLEEAIRINPDYVEAHNNLGNLLAMQGGLDEAARHFRRALEMDPAQSEIRFSLGNLLVRQGRLAEAMDQFREALKINPDYAEAYHNLGRVEAARGELERAIEHFRQALRTQPQFAEAHESLGRALAQRGRKEEAAQHYQQAMRIMKLRRLAPAPSN